MYGHRERSRVFSQEANVLSRNQDVEEWSITVWFYAALHLFDAYIKYKDPSTIYETHFDRARAIKRRPELRNIRHSYGKLQNLSEQQRYDPEFKVKKEHIEDARKYFEKIAAVILPKLKEE